ncbi:MAG: enolase C-terminal domain-like protein [Pseudomonadota bacterium]
MTVDASSVIDAMDLWHCEVPVVSKRDHGIGTVADKIDIVVVRLTSNDGAEGFGEASPWVVFTGPVEATYAALDRYMRPFIVGTPVLNYAKTLQKCRRAVAHSTEAMAALETAYLDLIGRMSGLPVHALLGGKVRDTIPLSVSLANPNFDEDRELLLRLSADDVGIVKLKAGFAGHDFDLERLEVLRRDWPEMDVRVDYNQGLSIQDAIGCVVDVASFEPTFIEQPVLASQYALMAEIRNAIDVPLIADESVFGPEDMHRAVREGIADGVSVKIMKAGGLRRALLVAEQAQLAGMTAYGGDMFETGLAHLAGTHMVAASPNITLGCEFYQSRYYIAEDILTEPFPVLDGEVVVPDVPGLGVDVNLEKVKDFTITGSGERVSV